MHSPAWPGDPKDNRAPFRDGRLDVGRARFRGVLQSDEAQSDLDRLAEQARQSRVAVLCFGLPARIEPDTSADTSAPAQPTI